MGQAKTMRFEDPRGDEVSRMNVWPRITKAVFSVLFAALALAGCTVGPNYVRPPAVTPEAFKEMDGWKKAEPADHLLRGKWWEIFNDPRLNALEEQVSISNQNVAAAEAQFRQARALVRVARSAYFPTATVGPSFSRSFQSTADGPVGARLPLHTARGRDLGAGPLGPRAPERRGEPRERAGQRGRPSGRTAQQPGPIGRGLFPAPRPRCAEPAPQ